MLPKQEGSRKLESVSVIGIARKSAEARTVY